MPHRRHSISRRALCLIPLAAIVVLVAPAPALAWSATGHMIAAAIAYRDLPPELQRTYIAILTAHPEYAGWKSRYEGNLDEGTYYFMRASVWPDELKQDRRNRDAHPEWHYVNIPLVAPHYRVQNPPKPGPKGDIISAIELNRTRLSSATSTPAQRAIALAWLIHLIGDLHQPLHTTALITRRYKAPKGDKGGNSFFIRPSEKAKSPISLHYFWDGLLGTSKNYRKAHSDALEIEQLHARANLSELKRGPKVRDWVQESRAASLRSAYLGGRLRGADRKTKTAPVVPESYRKDSKAIAERRIALAGYRLADMLR